MKRLLYIIYEMEIFQSNSRRVRTPVNTTTVDNDLRTTKVRILGLGQPAVCTIATKALGKWANGNRNNGQTG